MGFIISLFCQKEKKVQLVPRFVAFDLYIKYKTEKNE